MARMRIGDMLIAAGLIDEMQLGSALAKQRQFGGRLGDVLVDMGFVDEMLLYMGLAKQMNVPLVSVAEILPAKEVIAAVPAEICKKHDLIAVGVSGREVTVAMSDPSNIAGIDEVAFRTGMRVKTVIAPAREIEWAHRRFFHGDASPCPPPKTRSQRVPTGQMEIIQVGGMGGPDLAPSAAAATTEGDALPPDPTLHLGDAVASDADPLDGLEEGLKETTHLLRLLVDTCVQRGLFSREEYLERVRRIR